MTNKEILEQLLPVVLSVKRHITETIRTELPDALGVAYVCDHGLDLVLGHLRNTLISCDGFWDEELTVQTHTLVKQSNMYATMFARAHRYTNTEDLNTLTLLLTTKPSGGFTRPRP